MKRKLVSVGILLCAGIASATAQTAPLGIAYQVTHSINMDPSLSPDGKEMVYIAVIAGKEQLFRVGLDGSNPMQLTHDSADHEDPAWSPDGKRIAFVLVRDGLEQIHLMNADGTGIEALTPNRCEDHSSELVS